MSLSPAERAQLAPYVTSLDSPVFVIRNLPEEVIAVLFAYYSRSRDDLRTNLLKLLQDQELGVVGAAEAGEPDEEQLLLARQKAKEFHEKWVVGYGHASVAEHAVAHIAVESASILVSKIIEDARLASYTEKSTRYVPFPRAYYRAAELPEAAGRTCREAVEALFDVYECLLPQVTDRIAETADRSQFKTDRGFRNSCQAQACDALRYLLPASTETNIGLTANARTLEGMISKLLSHPLAEARETGERIQQEATKVIPTLIKYARRKDYWEETPPVLRSLADSLLGPAVAPSETGTGSEVRLATSPEEPEAALAASILYEFSSLPFDVVRERVRAAGLTEQERVIEEYLARRRTYGVPGHSYTDPPLRSLEHLMFTFDILVDYGAYRDIQRHRMATQTAQRLGCEHGYDVPEILTTYGFGPQFEAAMENAARAYEALKADHPEEAQYLVPLAYRKRVLFTWNLRAIHHFVSLRSARQGHPSYRRVAQQVYAELERAHPFLARFVNVDLEDYDMARPG